MPRCLRSALSVFLLLVVSGCCGFLGGPTQTKLMIAPVAAFDSGDSDFGLLASAGCPCPALAGLLWGLGGGYVNNSFQDYYFGRLWGTYVLATGDAITPMVFLSAIAKRHRAYDQGQFSGGGASLFQETGSDTNLGISFGIQVDYDDLEQVTPFARFERWQIDGGGFQMASIGLGFNVGN